MDKTKLNAEQIMQGTKLGFDAIQKNKETQSRKE